jgi:hypothetical protein
VYKFLKFAAALNLNQKIEKENKATWADSWRRPARTGYVDNLARNAARSTAPDQRGPHLYGPCCMTAQWRQLGVLTLTRARVTVMTLWLEAL